MIVINDAGQPTVNGLTYDEHLDAIVRICNELLDEGDIDSLKECFDKTKNILLLHVIQMRIVESGRVVPPELLVGNGPRRPHAL